MFINDKVQMRTDS